MTATEVARARERFRVDQEHGEFVEYAEACSRISRTRQWRRRLHRFLREHDYGCARSEIRWDELLQDRS